MLFSSTSVILLRLTQVWVQALKWLKQKWRMCYLHQRAGKYELRSLNNFFQLYTRLLCLWNGHGAEMWSMSIGQRPPKVVAACTELACTLNKAARASLIPMMMTMNVHAMQADAVFLSPPWGGPAYNASSFDVDKDVGNLGVNYCQLMHIANSALYHKISSLAPSESPAQTDSIDACLNEPHQDQRSEQNRQAQALALVDAHGSGITSSQRAEPFRAGKEGGGNGSHRQEDLMTPGAMLSGITDQRLSDIADQTLAALASLHPNDSASPGTSIEAPQDMEAGKQLDSSHVSTMHERQASHNSKAAHQTAPIATERIEGSLICGKAQLQETAERPIGAPPDVQEAMPLSGEPESDASAVLQSKGIACFLPKSTNLQQLSAALADGSFCEVERNFLNGRLKSVTVYHGPCANPILNEC